MIIETLEKYVISLIPIPIEKAKLFAEQFEMVDLLKNTYLLKEKRD